MKMTLADCWLTVQFDNVDLAEYGCEALLEKARRAGADGIELERCIFYPDFLRRFPNFRPLRNFTGGEAADCLDWHKGLKETSHGTHSHPH